MPYALSEKCPLSVVRHSSCVVENCFKRNHLLNNRGYLDKLGKIYSVMEFFDNYSMISVLHINRSNELELDSHNL